MIKYKTETYEVERIALKVCDNCEGEYTEKDIIEWQEFHHIDFEGGFGSVFGDGTRVQCDLCQNCFKALIIHFCRFK